MQFLCCFDYHVFPAKLPSCDYHYCILYVAECCRALQRWNNNRTAWHTEQNPSNQPTCRNRTNHDEDGRVLLWNCIAHTIFSWEFLDVTNKAHPAMRHNSKRDCLICRESVCRCHDMATSCANMTQKPPLDLCAYVCIQLTVVWNADNSCVATEISIKGRRIWQ